MKTTEDTIRYLSNHPWLKKQFAKLKQSDILVIADFLDRRHGSKEDAVKEATALLLSCASKNKLVIDELISCGINFRFS